MCNKKRGLLGFFLIKFAETNALQKEDLIVWKNKLNTGDCNIFINRTLDPVTKKYSKELVIGYKTIYINSYNVFV